MKVKQLFLTFALLLGASSVWADNTLSVKDVNVTPSGKVAMAVEANLEDANLIGAQFDITFPAGVSVAERKNAAGTKHGISMSKVGDAYRFVFADTENNGAFPTGKFVLMELTLETTGLTAGTKLTAKIENITFPKKEGDKQIGVNFADVNFNVNVNSAVVISEEDAFVAAATDDAVDIKVIRTINANEWSTICLPFEMDDAQLKAAFGDDVKMYEFSDYEVADGNIAVNFEEVDIAEDGLIANNPYLIKTSKAISEFTVTAEIAPDEEEAVAEYKVKKKTVGSFIGTLKAGKLVPKDDLFLNGGKFYYSAGKNVIKGLRGYFEFTDVYSPASARVNIVFNDATGIRNINAAADSDKVFDLQGRAVNTPAKGVFIKGGKKVVVK
jgi:hypothetical protein